MYSTASFAFTSTFSWKFFITGRFVQRLKLLNLAHLYGLAKYMHSTVLLLSPQHFPESSFTALFLISWIGPTSTIFQQNYYFLILPNTASLAFTSTFSWKFIHSLVSFNLLNWCNLQKLSAELFFFITGLIFQRMKLLNLTLFYGLVKWNGVMCPCCVGKRPGDLQLASSTSHGETLRFVVTWQTIK